MKVHYRSEPVILPILTTLLSCNDLLMSEYVIYIYYH